MEIHRCTLCFRKFSNGRALGGHMKSHAMNFCSSKKRFFGDSDELQSIHSSSSSRAEDELISVVLQDGESEAESLVHRRKRSRIFSRAKKSPEFGEINEELSSVSDTTTEEDVAHCLMMLSRDQWERGNENKEDKVMKNGNKVRGKYKCETCNKLFKSYQALGGHRASYKKIKADVAVRPARAAATVVAEVKVHECPFCHRVFASGQALGGHKRSHFMGSSSIKNAENLDIDLNLPATIDLDDDEISFSDQ